MIKPNIKNTIFVLEGKFDKKFITDICSKYEIQQLNSSISINGNINYDDLLECNGKNKIHNLLKSNNINSFLSNMKSIIKYNNSKLNLTNNILFRFEIIILCDYDHGSDCFSNITNLEEYLKKANSLLTVYTWKPNIETKLCIKNKKEFWKNEHYYDETQIKSIEEVLNIKLSKKDNIFNF